MRLLIVDIARRGFEDYREGLIIGRSLRFKLLWDMLYKKDPAWSRFQAGPAGLIGETGVGFQTTYDRAKKLVDCIRIETAGDAARLAAMIKDDVPAVLFLGSHGSIRDGQITFSGHTSDAEVRIGPLARSLAGTDLSSTCIIASGCNLGTKEAVKQLRRAGFGCGIGWPGYTCATETFAFDMDFFEAMVFLYALAPDPFDLKRALPGWLRKAFKFALRNLKSRYSNSQEVFGRRGSPDHAGYYMHTRPWHKVKYAAMPLMWKGRRTSAREGCHAGG